MMRDQEASKAIANLAFFACLFLALALQLGGFSCTGQQKKQASAAFDAAQNVCVVILGFDEDLDDVCIEVRELKEALGPIIAKKRKNKNVAASSAQGSASAERANPSTEPFPDAGAGPARPEGTSW